MALPVELNAEVGYALWWLTHDEHGTLTPSDIVQRLIARGHVANRAEARAVLRQAQANVRAQRTISHATGSGTLAAACGYKCPPNTPIALRVRMDVVDGRGNLVESRSIVINATAGQNLQYVLDRARQFFNQRYRRGNQHYAHSLNINRPLTPADVDQVLLNYTEGSVWA